MAKKFGKPINQYLLDGSLVSTYQSINEASRKTDIHKFGIQKALKSETKTYKDFKWEYV